jgi:hypothetical protein
VWVIRGRKKKLLVAFHFQYSTEAAWNCDKCRSGGLAQIRNCAWLPEESRGKDHRQGLVWCRKGVATSQCPKNEITASSVSWLEAFQQWKALGPVAFGELDVRTADAFLVLEEAYREEL